MYVVNLYTNISFSFVLSFVLDAFDTTKNLLFESIHVLSFHSLKRRIKTWRLRAQAHWQSFCNHDAWTVLSQGENEGDRAWCDVYISVRKQMQQPLLIFKSDKWHVDSFPVRLGECWIFMSNNLGHTRFFIFSHFDWICCDGTEGVCMCVCVCGCVCVFVCVGGKHCSFNG